MGFCGSDDPTDIVKALKEVVVLRIGFNPTRSTLQCYNTTHACNKTCIKMNLSTVKWAQWDKTQSRELLVLFMCACIALCTTVAHNIAQIRFDNFAYYPPDNHHWSDYVCLSEEELFFIGNSCESLIMMMLLKSREGHQFTNVFRRARFTGFITARRHASTIHAVVMYLFVYHKLVFYWNS